MKRCYYISNSYDGKYFVLTDSVKEYATRMAAYVMNLERSGKCNHYSFGSVELTEAEYELQRTEAHEAELGRIEQVKNQIMREQKRKESEGRDEKMERLHDPSIPLPKPGTSKRPNPGGLRLV